MCSPPMTEIRAQLRCRRLELGLSVPEVLRRARALYSNVKGLHPTALLAWEADVPGRAPSDEQLVALAAALGFTIKLHQITVIDKSEPADAAPTNPVDSTISEDTADAPSGGRQRGARPRRHASAA